MVRGLTAIDKRTAAARSLIADRDEWIQDMGGPEAISGKQRVILEAAVRTNLYIQHLDAWLMEQRSLVNFKRRSVLPVLKERQTLVDSLARLLGLLGLERKAKPVPSLQDYLRDIETKKTEEIPA